MSALETAYGNGQVAALRKLGLAQPSLGSVGISSPVKAPTMPGAATLPKLPTPTNVNPGPSMGQQAAKIAMSWSELSDPVRRGLAGAGLGAGIGAVTDKENRGRGALVGAGLGGVTGGLHGRFKPSPRGPTTTWAQALDNTSPDWITENLSHVDGADARQAAASRVSRTAKESRPAFQQDGHTVKRTGRHYQAEMDMKRRDVVGRRAPIVVHGTWSPGMSEADVLREALEHAKNTPSTHVKESELSLGQRAAKIAAPQPTHATVKGSPLLGGKTPGAVQIPSNPTTPATVQSVFDVHEQSKTRLEPAKKLGADICTSCRKPTHYGPCLKSFKTRPAGTPVKKANFNFGMKGEDALSMDRPATSSRYNSSVVNPEPGRTFSRVAPSTSNTETVSIDQLGHVPDGEPAALG